MHEGSADEAVVVVKRVANEGMVTYPRVKRSGSAERRRRRAEYANDRMEIIRSNLYEVRLKLEGSSYHLRRTPQARGREMTDEIKIRKKAK